MRTADDSAVCNSPLSSYEVVESVTVLESAGAYCGITVGKMCSSLFESSVFFSMIKPRRRLHPVFLIIFVIKAVNLLNNLLINECILGYLV
jgi:hypothetical protein